ncbi:hypothetical protein D3C78_1745920 [compost metagenome]
MTRAPTMTSTDVEVIVSHCPTITATRARSTVARPFKFRNMSETNIDAIEILTISIVVA